MNTDTFIQELLDDPLEVKQVASQAVNAMNMQYVSLAEIRQFFKAAYNIGP